MHRELWRRQRLVLVLVLHRHWLVLVLLAAPPMAGAACAGAPPKQHVEVVVSRVVDANACAVAASWVLYRRQLLVL